MKYLAEKLPFDPLKLRGPQIKYHPHMEIRVRDRQIKNREGREEVIWNKANYVRLKKAEFAKELGQFCLWFALMKWYRAFPLANQQFSF